ncbi:MAG: hypothetical protein IJU26_04130 [Synergistaceae bacterium]|nr:hypothetical protein [Synergistaceae bacterium]
MRTGLKGSVQGIVISVVQLAFGTYFLAIMVAGFYKRGLNVIESVTVCFGVVPDSSGYDELDCWCSVRNRNTVYQHQRRESVSGIEICGVGV